MKKIVNRICIIVMIILLNYNTFALEKLSVYYDEKKIEYNSDTGYPYIDKQEGTMVPLIKTFESMGKNVHWDKVNQKAWWYDDGNCYEILVNSNIFIKNDVIQKPKVITKMISEIPYVHFSIFLYNLDYQIDFNFDARSFTIDNKQVSESDDNLKDQVLLYDVSVESFDSFNDLKEMIIEEELDIHVYYTYGESLVNEQAKEKVIVRDLQKPALIILSGYEAIEWELLAEDPSDVRAICLGGYSKQILADNKKPSIFSSGAINLRPGGGLCGQLKLAEDIQYTFGRPLSSLWGTNNEIDGVNTYVIKPFDYDIGRKVELEYEDGSISASSNKMYSSEVAEYTGNRNSQKYESNQGYLSGKYYFEVEICIGDEEKLGSNTNFGIGTENVSDWTTFDIGAYSGLQSSNGESAYGAIAFNKLMDSELNTRDSEIIKTGDIVGVAMNLDEHLLYFSLNGKWVSGHPNDINLGRAIKDNRIYYAKASITANEEASDILKFSFEKEKFKYEIPMGYLPFDN